MSRRPIFRRKRHAPECRPRFGKFQPDLPLSPSYGAKKHHAAFLLFLRMLVLQPHGAAARQPRLQQYQCSVRVDGQGAGLFFKLPAVCVRAAYFHRYLHQYSLASPACTWMVLGVRRCGHGTSYSSNIPLAKRMSIANQSLGMQRTHGRKPAHCAPDKLFLFTYARLPGVEPQPAGCPESAVSSERAVVARLSSALASGLS